MLEKFFDEEEIKILKIIALAANMSGGSVYLVGGVVRDILLRKESVDIDIALTGNIANFVAVLKQKTLCNIIKAQQDLRTVRIAFKNGFVVDIATTRQEIYGDKKGIPMPKSFGCSLKEDILRRDFTINSLAISINKNDYEKIIDYVGGIEDLKNRKLKVLHDKSFEDDPSRIIRAFKFANRFNMTLDENTKKLQEEYINSDNCCVDVSVERVKKEMMDAFVHVNENMYNQFFAQKIYKILSNNVNKIPYARIKELVDKYKPDDEKIPFIYFASIFLSEPNYPLFAKMNLTKDEFKIVQDIKFLYGAKYQSNDMAIFRQYSNRQKESLVLELILKDNDHIRTYLEKMSNVKIEITGDDLIIMGISPSKNFKVLFDKVLEEKIKGNLPDKISELRFVRKLILSGEV